MLGGHVGQRAADQGGRGVRAQLGVGGQVEVEQQRLAVVAEQDVGRLEVAMEDAAFVGVGQPVGQAGGQPEDRLDVAEPADALELGGRPDLGRSRGATADPLIARGRRPRAGPCRRSSSELPGRGPASRTTCDGGVLSRPAPESGSVGLCFSSRRTSAKVPEPR